MIIFYSVKRKCRSMYIMLNVFCINHTQGVSGCNPQNLGVDRMCKNVVRLFKYIRFLYNV